jgi:hypothetical protein
MEAPKRRFELEIIVSGDSWDDVIFNLKDLVPHVIDHGPECRSISGSPSSSHCVTVTERPDMTHEKYFEQIDEYLNNKSG